MSVQVAKWGLWHSLRFRFILGGVLALVLAFTLIGLNTSRILNAFSNEILQASLKQTSETLNIAVTPHTDTGDWETLGDYFEELITSTEYGIVYIALLDGQGQKLIGTKSTPLSWVDADQQSPEQLNDGVIHVKHPILLTEGRIGTLRYGFTSSVIKQANLWVIKENLGLIAIILLVLLGAMSLVSVRLYRRINHLISATSAFASGSDAARAPEQGKDELAQLGRSFNLMADVIRERSNALRDSRDELEHAQAVAHIGSWKHLPDSETYHLSAEAAKVMGLSPSEQMLTVERLMHLVNSEDREELLSELMAPTAGEPNDVTFRINVNGEERNLFVQAVSRFDDAGRVILTMGTVQDITERRRLDEELEGHRHHLERLVEDRTRELDHANERLREAVVKAMEANRARGTFLANMSHEIRTPLNAILGMSYISLKAETDPKQRHYIEKIHRSAENLLGVINDILDFSKIESGKLEMESTRFRLEDVLDYVDNIVGLKCAEKGIRLSREIAPDVPMGLIGDPLRLGQVILNLANNAVKFTPENGAVSIGVEVQEKGAGTAVVLHFWMRDSGIGMSEEQQAKLFEAFTQADSTTTRKYGGTGLGLAISKNLVDLWGGRIWAESALERGSTFHFSVSLERQVGDISPRRTIPSQSLDDVVVSARLRGAKVLLVEDNPINQELARELLRDNGIYVRTAGNGQEALEILDTEAFDGVLMDCQMPVMDGYQATRHLRQQARYRDLPIIAMTANVMKGDKEEALAAGMSDHIGKPINVHQMFETMAKWIKASAHVPDKPGKAPVATRNPSDAQDEWLRQLPGLDVHAGLHVVQGNVALYRRLLVRIYEGYQDFEQQFREVLAAREMEKATRLAHSLKGVAGNVGARGVQRAAQALEFACRDGDDPVDQLLIDLLSELQPLLDGVAALNSRD